MSLRASETVRCEGTALQEAILRASTSRSHSVIRDAAKTILGVAPLSTDGFFVSMGIRIKATSAGAPQPGTPMVCITTGRHRIGIGHGEHALLRAPMQS